jgi:hypothetical protein
MLKRPRRYRREAAARASLAHRDYTVEVATVMADGSVPDGDNLNRNGASFKCGSSRLLVIYASSCPSTTVNSILLGFSVVQ